MTITAKITRLVPMASLSRSKVMLGIVKTLIGGQVSAGYRLAVNCVHFIWDHLTRHQLLSQSQGPCET